MDLLKLEFDIRYINAVSRRIPEEHALIRLIISALATPEEIQNLVKRDLRVLNRGGERVYTVKLTHAGRSRVAPIDWRTYELVVSICKDKGGRQRIFEYSKDDIDRIVEKYSPRSRRYNAKRLREAVIEILKDCLFNEHDYVSDLLSGNNLEGVIDFVNDFHPMFSGMWDLDDEEAAEDFIENYIAEFGETDVERIANEICEDVRRVERIMRRILPLRGLKPGPGFEPG